MRRVRSACQRLLVRCSACRACCSTLPHGPQVGAACSFEQCGGVGRVGLVAAHVGAHVACGQQRDLDAQTGEPACPVVGRAAGFHDHARHRAVGKPALELSARQTLRLDGAPLAVGHAQRKHGLGQIDADDHAGARLNRNGKARSIHVGLLRVMRRHPHHATPAGTLIPKCAGESIPSFERTAFGVRSLSRWASHAVVSMEQ